VAVPGKWTLTVFPNPVSAGRVRLELSGLSGKASISIFSINGTLVRNLEIHGRGAAAWDLLDSRGHAVASGTYHAVVRNSGGKRVRIFNLQIIK